MLELYPESGKAYKRTYRTSEKKRLERLKLKEERKKSREEQARLKEQGVLDARVPLPPTMATRSGGKYKSEAIVRDSDDEEEDEASSE